MKYNILVTDDEIDNLQLFKRTLRSNYNVFLANSGFEALEILKSNKIDMIISDQKMPGMDGVELLKKTLNYAPDAVRILITAYTDSSSLIRAINEGKIHRYLRKPWNANDLLKRHLLIYGLGGLVLPFIGIKLLDILMSWLMGV